MTDDLELAERAARAAGEVLMSYFGRAAEGLDAKSSPTDLVSDADREAEEPIRELLRAERPDDGLIGEEGSRPRRRQRPALDRGPARRHHELPVRAARPGP